MFAQESNASKAAFITLADHLCGLNFDWIDCQIMNPHLASLGAHHISRQTFLEELQSAMEKPTRRGPWNLTTPS